MVDLIASLQIPSPFLAPGKGDSRKKKESTVNTIFSYLNGNSADINIQSDKSVISSDRVLTFKVPRTTVTEDYASCPK